MWTLLKTTWGYLDNKKTVIGSVLIAIGGLILGTQEVVQASQTYVELSANLCFFYGGILGGTGVAHKWVKSRETNGSGN